ncbi:MAG: sulfotransferase [Cyclobacteriaceae bacterium]
MEIKEPNFLVIGAGKSGTTSLYEYLNEHPEVFMSPIKETNFFALEGEQLEDQENDPEQMRHYPWSITDQESYSDLFKDAGDHQAIGEVSPMYLYSKKAAFAIKKRMPRVKLIAILRQPTERLYSRYLHLAREGRTLSSDIEDALDRKSIWWKRNDLVQEGFYHSHLNHYFNLFSEEQIHIVLYEDFRNNPQNVIEGIYKFIGVDPCFMPSMDTEYNVSGFVANANVDKIIGQNSMVKSMIVKAAPSLAKYLSESRKVKSWVNQLRNRNLRRPPLSARLKRQINEIYSTEIIRLQVLINRDLSHWLTK